MLDTMLIAGLSASIAGGICNPLEVVKIRMQLQGELKARGQYSIHYKNVFHAFYTIVRKDGFLALEKGLVPFMLYQFTSNAIRLGSFQIMNQKGWTRTNGKVHTGKTLLIATCGGALGGVVCSPFYLVKTHLQSKVNDVSIAVGHQHKHTQGVWYAFSTIYKDYGVKGLWRGTSSMVPRIAMTSATQLTSFEVIHEFTKKKFPDKIYTPLCLASFGTGFFMTLGMAPFDVISTRFYNQGIDNNTGRGILYRSVVDCAVKTFQKEGILGFFKGWTACYFRLGPYTMLVMVIWDRLKYLYTHHQESRQ